MTPTVRFFDQVGRWLLGFLRYSVIGCIGLWALWVQLEYRIPGPLLFLLPWLSLGLLALSVLMLGNHFIPRGWMPEPARRGFALAEYWGSLVILVFACWSLVVFANCFSDRSPPVPYRTEVRSIARWAFDVRLVALTPVSWVGLRSWKDPSRIERLALRWPERGVVWVGRPVVVRMQAGKLGIPWVNSIEEDIESYHRAVLEMSPTSANSWRMLTLFYIRERRFLEAAETARQYRDKAPHDVQFLTSVAAHLGESGFSGEVVKLLEPLATRQNSPSMLHIFLGMALAYTGQRERGVATLEQVLAKDPDDVLALYGLAELYEQWGPDDRALEYYEKVLQRAPDLADTPDRAAAVRARLGRRTSTGGETKAASEDN